MRKLLITLLLTAGTTIAMAKPLAGDVQHDSLLGQDITLRAHAVIYAVKCEHRRGQQEKLVTFALRTLDKYHDNADDVIVPMTDYFNKAANDDGLVKTCRTLHRFVKKHFGIDLER